ncbi:MAG: hypothetical protein M1383_05270 [Patescibacteria group bacterium]|nr:hypothetical protein [Patescibacteria group bacterium]
MSPQKRQLLLASEHLIPLSEAAKLTPYSAEYLGYLVRKGKIEAIKMSRDWMTTKEIVLEYTGEQEGRQRRLFERFQQVSAVSQAGFIAFKTLLGTICLAIIATESVLIGGAVHLQPRNLLSETAHQIYFKTSSITNKSLAVAGSYAGYFNAELDRTILALGLNINSDLESADYLACSLGYQTKQLAKNLITDVKAPYIAAGDVIRSALGEQATQAAWAFGNAKSGWNQMALFYNNQLSVVAHNAAHMAKPAVSNSWNNVVENVGLLDKLAGNNFSTDSYVSKDSHLISGSQVVAQNDTKGKVLGKTISVKPAVPTASKIATVKPKATAINQRPKTQPVKSAVITYSAADPSYINQLIDSRLNQYLAAGKFKGAKGDKGDAGGMVTGSNGQQTVAVGGYPLVTYYPSNPAQNFSGASLAGFTDLSSNNFSTGKATVSNTLTVSGAASFLNTASFATTTISSLAVSGTATLPNIATTTISSLTVSGPVTLSGSATIVGLTVTGLNPGLALGSVAFQGDAGLAEDNSNFYWDKTNHRLGVGTSSPVTALQVAGIATLSGLQVFGNSTTTGNQVIGGNNSVSGNQNISGLSSLATTTVTRLTATGSTTIQTLTAGVVRSTSGGDLFVGQINNADLVNSSLTVTAGTGLTSGGSVSLGGSTSLGVAYGAALGTAVQGNTQLTVTAGTNLTGGGTITLGLGGTLALAVSSTPTFTTINGLTLTAGTGTLALNNNTLTVTGNSTINQNLTTTSTPAFTGLAVNGILTVTGASNLATATITSLAVSGPAVLSGSTTIASLTVSGISTLQNLNFAIATGTSLTVLSTSTLNSVFAVSLTVTGTSTLATTSVTNLSVTGPAVFNSLTASGTVFSSANLIGTTTSYGLLTIQGSGTSSPFTVLSAPDASSSVSTILAVSSVGNISMGLAATTSTSSLVSRLNITGVGTTTASSSLNIQNSAGLALLFARNDGQIGIGTTSPNATLAIQGTAGSTAQLFDVASSTGISYFHITSSGQVGIGTSTPAALLYLYSTSTSTPLFAIATATNASIFNILANGYTGVGKIPLRPLDVNGIARADSFEQNCPAGYIWVPGSAKYGTLPGFCAMKYVASSDGTTNCNGAACPVSTAANLPWVSINWNQSQTACQSLGLNYHLISDQEWMTIADNAGHTPINDLDSAAGLQMANGHSDNAPANALASSAGSDPVVSGCNLNKPMYDASNAYVAGSCEIRGAGSGGYTDADKGYYGTGQQYATTGYSSGGSNSSQMRTKVLSNGTVIWDIGGNVWQWTDAYIYSATSTEPTEMPTPADQNWHNYSSITNYKGLNYIRPWLQTLTSSNGIGQIYTSNTNADDGSGYHAFERGAGWGIGSAAGAFALILNYGPSFTFGDIGFRCSR